jgi:hypothetical protein
MSRIKRTSPALVVAIVALIAALVVPALALDKSEKRVVKKVAANQVKTLAPGLSVASAGQAANADQLDGRDASAFAPAGEVHTPGRFVLNDPVPGDLGALTQNVLTVGAFAIQVSCADNEDGTGVDSVFVSAQGPSGSSITGLSTDGPFSEVSTTGATVVSVITSGSGVKVGHVTMAAPSGEVLSATVSAEVGDPAGDCIVGVTAIGP